MQEEISVWDGLAALFLVAVLFGVLLIMLLAAWQTMYNGRNVTDEELFGKDGDDNDINERRG